MNTSTVEPNVAKPRRYTPAPNLFRSMVQSKILSKQKDHLGSALVHEVRNPLTNINLAVEALTKAITDNNQKKYLDIIRRSSIRIEGLITDLLKSRYQGEELSEKYSIHQLLDEVIEMAADRMQFKNIKISKNYSCQDFKIALNRSTMKIALTNIIINAIDAMPSNNGELKLITTSIEGKYIIEIEDNGCGISRKNLKYIFAPYYSNKPGGLGLGLSTTYDILRSNSIRVNVKSEEGHGTCFVLLFDKKTPE